MRYLGAVLAFAVLLGIGGLAYVLWQMSQQASSPPPLVAAPPPPPVVQPPPAPVAGIRHPVEQVQPLLEGAPEEPAAAAPAPAPLTLDDSDAELAALLQQLVPNPVMRSLINGEGLVRRVVVTVDNLPRSKVSRRMTPLKGAEGALLTEGDTLSGLVIAEANAARYEPLLALVDSVDLRRLVAAYVRLYPLFQQAYREQGYPSGYFNDRLVEVIDHLLAAPVPAPPIRLVQPKVLYEYADPGLERMSEGHKLLVRMGPRQAGRIQARLGELRGLLTGTLR